MVEVNDQDIKGSSVNYHADHIFDSRIPPAFHVKQDDYHSLIQHSRVGWIGNNNLSRITDPATV